jgi:hypothetical protein
MVEPASGLPYGSLDVCFLGVEEYIDFCYALGQPVCITLCYMREQLYVFVEYGVRKS